MSVIQTGKVTYGNLQQVYLDSGDPTDEDVKANSPDDPDYIPPQIDTETCPATPVPEPDINRIRVQFVNNTTQVVVLTNIVVRSEAITDLSKAYYQNTSLSLMPGNSANGSTVDQLDDFSRILATVGALSKGIRIKIDAQYKLATDSSYASVVHQDGLIGDPISLLVGTMRIAGTGVNQLRFVMTEHPVSVDPDNDPPVVDAGEDQVINLPATSAVLVGVATDIDGTIVNVLWSQVSGPTAATMSGSGALTQTVSALVQGTYVFKLTATDDDGATGTDQVTVTVGPAAYNPNGIVNVFVDGAMPDITNSIVQVTLRNMVDLSTTNLLTSPITKTDGVVHKTPLKGLFNIEVQVVVNAGPHSIKLEWGNSHQVIVRTNASGVFAFEGVQIDEGTNGLNVTFAAAVLSGAIVPLYAKLIAASPVVESEATAPFGLEEVGKGDVVVSFYSDLALTTPAPYTGIMRTKVTTVNNMTSSTSISSIVSSLSSNATFTVNNIQSMKRWDYTRNNPAVAEDPADKIEDVSYTYSLINGQGYLIIP